MNKKLRIKKEDARFGWVTEHLFERNKRRNIFSKKIFNFQNFFENKIFLDFKNQTLFIAKILRKRIVFYEFEIILTTPLTTLFTKKYVNLAYFVHF